MIKAKLKEIAELCLYNDGKITSNIDKGLYSGLMGLAIFNLEYYKYTKEEKYYDSGMAYLEQIIGTFRDIPSDTFCNGISGVGWGLLYLKENNLVEIDNDGFFYELDNYLYEKMQHFFSKNNWDFLHGGLGILMYYVKRYEMDDIKEVKVYIEKGVEKIKNIGVKHSNNRLAYSMISNPNDTDSFAPNISLAHGMSSILVLLTKIYKLKISENKVKGLMKSISLFIIDQRNIDFKKTGSYFPHQSLEYNIDNLKSRMAWCYGDLGIANALYIYGDTIHNNEIKELSIEIVEFSTKRIEQEDTYVIDSGICHGTSGISYIFKRFYERTKIKNFEKSSNYWQNETLLFAKYSDGLAGYKTYQTKKYGGWSNKFGILDGISGNGIVLLSNFCDSSKWDECFLLR